MSLGFRGRLMLASVALIALGLVVSLTYLELSLRRVLDENAQAELSRHAGAYRAALRLAGDDAFEAAADRLAKSVGREHPIRLTLVAPDGRAAADSDTPAHELGALGDHRPRPEVQRALDGAVGVARRYSTTLAADMLYVAVPFDRAGGRWAVRAGMPLSRVDALIRELRAVLVLAGLIGLVVAVFMSGLASHLITRTLRDVVASARRVTLGSAAGPAEGAAHDEIENLAGSVNRLAREVKDAVGTLGRERDRVSAILASLQEGVLSLDEKRTVELTNPAAVGLLALERSPVARPLIEVIRVPEVVDLISDGLEREIELELVEPPRRLSIRVAKKSSGDGFVLVLRDVTEVRRLESVRSELVANVSHELRTPVAVIRANAEALKEGAIRDPEKAAFFVDALFRNAERLSQLVSDILDLARAESSGVAPKVEDVALASVCARAVEALKLKIEERRHAFALDVPDELHVAADERALEQVMVNLVENAVKYTPHGGHIDVRARADGDEVRIEVSDDGPGIPRAHRERIFERFYRVDAGRSREMGGTGLGLAIVKHLVMNMNGRVGVVDNEPKGSVFFVELPRAA